MRTAIFVYRSTTLSISTYESDLELCCMGADTVPLSQGDSARTLAPGIYKIVSSQDVRVAGDASAFDITTFDKTNDPDFTPARVTETFTSLDPSALQAFMTVPDAKVIANP